MPENTSRGRPAPTGRTETAALRTAMENSKASQPLPPGQETPNAETLQAFRDIETGTGLHYARDAEEMFEKLGL